MYVGAGIEDITPPVGTHMSGFVAREQPSVGVHCPLKARALVVEGDGGRLVWLHGDVIAFEYDDALCIRKAVAKVAGVPIERVILTATHTHSGPAIVRLSRCGDYDPKVVALVTGGLLKAAEQALSRLEPAEFVVGVGTCELGIDRRRQERKHTEKRVSAWGWRRSNGEWIAVMTNYALHNVAMGGENRLFCGDISGHLSAELETNLPGSPVVLCTNGPCGNINPPSVGPDFERMLGWSKELGGVMAGILSGAEPCLDETVSAAESIVPSGAVRLNTEEVNRRADSKIRDLDGQPGATAERCRQAARDWREAMLGELPERAYGAIPVQAVRIGDRYAVGIGAEPFSVIADGIRERTGQDLLVVGYANGDAGYLAPEYAYDEGGYEVDGAFVFYGTLPIPRGAFERVMDEAVTLVGSL